jgi:lantibiotic modifying enzyme
MKTVERRKHLEEKLIEFADYLKRNQNDQINLISGSSGEVLFLGYFSRYFKDETFAGMHDRLDTIVNSINSGELYPTFAGGIAGIMWLLEHLTKEEFIDFDLDDMYADTDEYLNECMIYMIKDNHYDYLHGALGIANYFLNRDTPKTNSYLDEFIRVLSANAIEDIQQKTVTFKSIITNTGKPFPAVNFSLSHGMASLLYFLQKSLLRTDLKKKETYQLISGVQNYYFQNQNESSFYNARFPSWIGEPENTEKNSRMAWCYGDVGIGMTFLNYGINHRDTKLTDYGIETLMRASHRRDPEKESIMDAGICHGSSGISMVYEKAYQLTKKKEFLETADYWLDMALTQSTHVTGICGYKAYFGVERGYINEAGLLEGISGIGLSFLTKLDGNLCNWKKAFMIN